MAAAWLPATLFSRFDFMLWSYLQIQVNSPVDFLKTYVHKWLWVLVQVCIIYTSNMSVAYWRQFDASRMSLLSLDGWPEIAKTTGRYYPTGYITHLNQQKTWLFPASFTICSMFRFQLISPVFFDVFCHFMFNFAFFIFHVAKNIGKSYLPSQLKRANNLHTFFKLFGLF